MAFKLPLREDFENWTTSQVADLLKQCGMQECIAVLDKLRFNGSDFLNMTELELHKFSIVYQPQLQKMVHDLKKNDGGLIQKFKRIKNKAPPSVPRRDYASGNTEDEEQQWSDEFDSDYENEHSDSETYVVPSEDPVDDNYEPPPSATEKKLPTSFNYSAGESGYADKQGNRQLPTVPSLPMSKPVRPQLKPNHLPSKPSQPLPIPAQRLQTPNQVLPKQSQPLPKPMFNKPATKPQITPRPHVMPQPQPAMKKPMVPLNQPFDDEEDYIVPEGEEDDNYIEPTQDPPQPYTPPRVNRDMKPTSRAHTKSSSNHTAREHDPAVYEVPETESEPSPPTKRDCLPLPRRHSPPKIEESSDQEYETCEDHNVGGHEPPNKYPSPLPRNGKSQIPLLPKPKPSLPQRDFNSNIEKPSPTERHRIPSVGTELPPLPPMGLKQPVPLPKHIIQKPPELPNRNMGIPSRNCLPSSPTTIEQEAGVLNKMWYAASCDRKTAEETLYSTCKDGSFLVRKSSGQDSKQPYTLVVFYNRRVYNIPVRYIESTRQYALGREKSGEEKFNSVAEMVENHQRNPLVLIDSQNNTKDSTKLKQAVKVA
ncbi:B-cell linker protein isoform 2-T2 [Discoglossus pictus]